MLKTVAVMAVALGVAVCTELSVRLLGIAPPLPMEHRHYVADPVLPYKPAPGSHVTGRSQYDEFDVDWRHNSWGFRDAEPTIPKPKGTFRIVGVGDSFTYGVGAPEDSTYLSVLQTLLGSRADVLNMGVPRFFTEAERLVLEAYGERLDPDLLIVGFVPNDVADAQLGISAIGVSDEGWLISSAAADAIDRLGPLPMALYQHSHAARIVIQGLVARWQTTDADTEFGDIYLPNGAMEGAWREVEGQFDQIAALSRRLGVNLLVVHIPQPPLWRREHRYPAERLTRWAQRAGVNFLDVSPYFAAHPDPASLYWPRDGHCTPRGYTLIGRAIHDHITAESLVP